MSTAVGHLKTGQLIPVSLLLFSYKYPKLVWDQTNETTSLKVLLRDVKEMTLNFSSRKIEFR